MKVVLNKCYGGFSLSKEACEYLNLDDSYNGWYDWDVDKRTDPKLVECVETLGREKASGQFACLKVVEVPDDVEWEITYHDGYEFVEEKHRRW